jgi:hypothetical protein
MYERNYVNRFISYFSFFFFLEAVNDFSPHRLDFIKNYQYQAMDSSFILITAFFC